jgi:hypothetical protein
MGKAQKRIFVAVIFGVVIVLGAYMIRTQRTPTNTEAVVETIERRYIKTIDGDQNGVPDWQDTLLEKDTLTIDNASTTYEKPTTLTGRFGISFFEKMVRSKMYGAFGDTQEELITKSVDRLKSEVVDELLTEKDIKLFDNTDSAVLKNYANTVAAILLGGNTGEENELLVLDDYMRYGDAEKLHTLGRIGDAYTQIIKNVLEVEVPRSYTKEHLDLLNAIGAVREDIRAMEKIETDALYTLLRTKRYEDDVLGMSNSIKNLFNTLYLRDAIRFEPDDAVLKLMVFPPTT